MVKRSATKSARGRRAWRHGQRAEIIIAILLSLQAWRIIGWRVQTGQGEIDLIARRGGVILFVEVKYRRTDVDAAESLSRTQQIRLCRAARVWLANNEAEAVMRFDVFLLRPWCWPRHIRHAWLCPN